MAEYIQIDNDGNRTVIKYNPRDGEVSKKISKIKKNIWLKKRNRLGLRF